MPHLISLFGFALVSLGMALTPGPNMIYLISRSITQGPAAGIVSLGGVALGFVFYMLCAAFGITALLLAVPYAYDALRLAGAAYLLWLAWQALKPGGRSPFQVKKLAVDGPRKLFAMGFVTNLLNPKIAMLYLALLPQFIDPTAGSVLTQSLALGSIQIVISVSVNAMIALAAGSIALFLGQRPTWLLVQRWMMGTVLAGLKATVEHAIEPPRLGHEALQPVRTVSLILQRNEMMHLAGKRPETTHLPHQPFIDRDTLAERFGQEFAGLLAKIKQDRAGFENADPFAVRPVGIDDRGNLVIGADCQKRGRHLLALGDVHRDYFVGQPHFLQSHRYLAAVRRVPGVQFDGHSGFPLKFDIPYPGISSRYNRGRGIPDHHRCVNGCRHNAGSGMCARPPIK